MAEFEIRYDQAAVAELKELRRHDQVAVLDGIERHLLTNPTKESRSRIKRLDPPVLASWRLRVGEYRVFYDVDSVNRIVQVIAIRFKGRRTLSEAADDPHNRP